MSGMGLCRRAIRTAPGVTQTIMDQGVVLAFLQATPVTSPLPLSLNSGTTAYTLSFILDVGKVFFYISSPNTGSAAGVQTTNAARYVIIPGGVAGGRNATVGNTGYTLEQIKSMSYERVAQIFNIPPTGSGYIRL
jgi:hypothetical protein